MAYDDQEPPWGQSRRPKTPEEFLAALLKKIKDGFEGAGGGRKAGEPGPGNGPGPGLLRGIGTIGLVLLALVAVKIVSSSVYTVKPGERGVVLRLGAFSRILDPGLNFVVPMLDTVEKVDIETVRKGEFGFRTLVAGQRSQFAKGGKETAESLMLTGDKNVIDVEWIVQYKVRDPFDFLFKVANVPQSVRDVSETVIRRVVGNMGFDYVLDNRELLAGQTTRELQKALDGYEAGVNVVIVQLQDVNPPDQVKPAFNEVNEADQDMKRLVNEAEEAYNKVIPKARGSAKQILEEAQGYAVERVNRSKGETSRYLALLEEYTRAKDVTRRRLYLEMMQEVLPQVADIYVFDKAQQSILPYLDVTGGRGEAAGVKARKAQ